MKVITIGGIDYTFEFSIEASLYSECTEKVTGLMAGAGFSQSEDETKTKEENEKNSIKNMLATMSDIPTVAMTMFYAGLIEHHGTLGDGRVKSIKDAKALVKTYLAEHKDDDKGNFYAIMQEMMECMADDDFFKLIGLDKMFQPSEEKKVAKIPQDHKKKATTKPIEK